MANHTKAVVTTDLQQKLLWDIIVDDGDNAGVDAWIQATVDAKIDACWNRLRVKWTKILMDDSDFTDAIPSNQADFVALVLARDEYKNRKAQDDATAL
jgi:hypothetical protein